MSKVLVLKFKSIFQSYGLYSNTETRDTYRLPTKSAIIGIILNSMNHDKNKSGDNDYNKIIQKYLSKKIPDKELTEYISNNLRIAVRDDSYNKKYKHNDDVDNNIYIDYQYAKGVKKECNSTIHKEYLIGREFLVLLEGEEELLKLIETCLEYPSRGLYLGRKNCLLDEDILFTTEDSEETAIVEGCLEDIIFDNKYNTNTYNTIPLWNRSHMIETKLWKKDSSRIRDIISNRLFKEHTISSADDIYILYSILPNADVIRIHPAEYRHFLYYNIKIKQKDFIVKTEGLETI